MLRGPSRYSNLILVGTQAPLPPEALFWQQLWRLARELEFPVLMESVMTFERVKTPG